MITQINNQSSAFAPSMFGHVTGTTKETAGARTCVNQSKKIAREADSQTGYAEAACDLLQSANEENSRKLFFSIAKWHFNNAAENYAEAASFLTAALDFNLTTRNRLYIETKRQDFLTRQQASLISADNLSA